MSWHPDLLLRLAWPTLRAALQPLTAAGRRQRDRSAAEAPTPEARRIELHSTRALEARLASMPALAPRLREGLESLGDPGPALALLRAGEPLHERDLFALRQLLHTALPLAEGLREDTGCELPDIDAPDPERLRELLLELEGGGSGSPGFALHAGHDPALGDLEAERLALLRSRVTLQRAEREAVEALLGVRADAEGLLWVPAAQVSVALQDTRLESARVDGGRHGLRPRPSDALREKERELRACDAAIQALRLRIAERLTAALRPAADLLGRWFDALVALDLRLARIALREAWQGCWAEEGDALAVEGAWLPALRQTLEARDERPDPLDLSLHAGIHLLTGPNMGGKSVALRTLATCALLGMLGWPVPARRCILPPLRGCALIGGEAESLEAGLSRFGSELASLSEALRLPGPLLLLLDEPAVATAPAEGSAFLQALLEHLDARHDVTALVATHLQPALRPEWRRWRVRGLQGVDAAALAHDLRSLDRSEALRRHMDYRLMPASEEPAASDALRIARAFSLPNALLDRAEALLTSRPSARDDEEPDA